ncbi:MAG: ABC transporter ATP-binding protein [Lachnospiraceae bacterium]|nr:ABC transporter ATP-binding protein [Lachnospiraceae bacterium]
MIEVENLVKRYGDHLAVDHLSFHVEPGKIYGFLGPNGAGKSTTMNIMTGYIAATEGTVKINGHDIIKDAEEAKKCIGYLPEIPPLYQDMTVREYLHFVAELKKIPKSERETQLREIMDLTMITDMEGRLIKNLSKGYKQRVGLAQAVLGYPEVIILDEPTVGLDPKQIIEIRDLIKKLGEKHTVILSSHILSEVQAVCDEIMIISKGHFVACDTPEGLTGLMNGNVQIELTILGSKEQVEEVLSGMEHLQAFSLKEGNEADCVKAVIESEAEVDIRTNLFYTLAKAKLPIMSMTRLEKSLEDVFLELTDSNKTAEEKGGVEDDSNL